MQDGSLHKSTHQLLTVSSAKLCIFVGAYFKYRITRIKVITTAYQGNGKDNE